MASSITEQKVQDALKLLKRRFPTAEFRLIYTDSILIEFSNAITVRVRPIRKKLSDGLSYRVLAVWDHRLERGTDILEALTKIK